jgi:acetyl esterase/lipase
VVGPPPPFDPELAAAVASTGVLAGEPLTAETVPTMRQAASSAPTDDELSRGGALTVEERLVPGPDDAPKIALLVCRPAAAEAPTGAVYFIHGGGMVSGDNRSTIQEALDWAQEFELSVISVAYRLAPETPHPGPVEDCYAGLLWSAAHAAELGIDRERIVVAGASSGAGLAAATVLLARDRGGPSVLAQLLSCPMLDDRNNSVSAQQMTGLGPWDRVSNQFAWRALLGAEPGGPNVSPYAAPARDRDLSDLPPAFVDAGSAETFRDEAVAYASHIWAAGGDAELHVWPGGYHRFDYLAPSASLSREAKAARVAWLRRHLTSTEPGRRH